MHGRCAAGFPDLAERRLRHVGDGAHRQPQGALAGDDRERAARCPGGAAAAREPEQVPVHGADRHHLDRRAQRHRRRGRLCRAAGRLAAGQRADGRALRILQRHRAGGGGHHLPDHHLRRAGAQAAGPDVPRDGGAPGGAADELAVDGDAALRHAARRLHRRGAAADRHARRPEAQRHRGGDRRQPGRGAGRRRDRGAGAPDAAQRVPPGRPAHRLDDDPAHRHRLARRRRADRRHAGRDDAQRALALPGVPRRAGRCHRRGRCARAAAAAGARRAARPEPAPGAAGVRARDPDRHGAAGELSRVQCRPGVRRGRVRLGAGPDHRARSARSHHRRVRRHRPARKPGPCAATTAAG